MTDYHSVIAREIAALGKHARPAERGALYERARAALIGLLEGSVTPALDESQMIRERLSLEEAIRKVEGEVVRESRARSKTAKTAKAPRFPQREEPPPDSRYPDDPLHELAKLIGGPSSRD
jgi:hypothetical protein